MVRLSPRFAALLTCAAAASALAAPAVADAAITPTAPAANAVTLSSAPNFTWALDADSVATGLQVAASANVDAASGKLVAPAIDATVAPGVTTYRPGAALQLFAGRWYWRVTGTTAGGADGSAPQLLVVKPQVAPPRLTKLVPARKGVSGVVQLRTNTARYKLRVRVKYGATVCLDDVVTDKRARARISKWDAFRIYCYPYGGVKAGTVATVTVTVAGNGVSRTTTRRVTIA